MLMLIGISLTIMFLKFIISQILLPPLSKKELLCISKCLEKYCVDPEFKQRVMPININNENDFIRAWEYVTDMIMHFDQNRNVFAVNHWSIYTVAMYTKYVLTYGTYNERRILSNFARLAKRNGFVTDEDEIDEVEETNDESNGILDRIISILIVIGYIILVVVGCLAIAFIILALNS